MNEREDVILKLQTGKLAMICELADALFQAGKLDIATLNDLERRVVRRIKNAEFAEWISDGDQIAIMETGIDCAQSDFAMLRNRLRRGRLGAAPRGR